MKKIIMFLTVLTMVFSLTACASSKVEETTPPETVIETSVVVEKVVEYVNQIMDNMKNLSSAPSENYKRGEFKKIADNLYEVEYYDYDIDYLQHGPSVVELEKILAAFVNAGCTSVRKGNFYGRNLDFIYGDLAEVIVKVKAKEGRYASVGVSGGFSYVSPEAIDNGYVDTISQTCLPIMVCDGINENGVTCNVNVVPANDLETFTTGTNPGKHDLNIYSVPRFVLDKSASAKEAIELLKNENIYTPWDACDLVKKGMEFHYMIADKDNTYVVEFINNKMQVTDLTDSNDKIMTNFYLYYKDNKTPHSSGVERYKIVQDQYENIASLDDMKKVMESVKFSKCYGDENGDGIWYSDNGFVANDGTEINFQNYEPYTEELKEKSKELRSALLKSIEEKNNERGFWITMHTSVFDMENRALEIAVQERYDKGYYRCAVEYEKKEEETEATTETVVETTVEETAEVTDEETGLQELETSTEIVVEEVVETQETITQETTPEVMPEVQ